MTKIVHLQASWTHFEVHDALQETCFEFDILKKTKETGYFQTIAFAICFNVFQ